MGTLISGACSNCKEQETEKGSGRDDIPQDPES